MGSIDWQLCLQLVNQRADTAAELLGMLVGELPQTQQGINQAFHAKDWQKLQHVVHKLHGATCYCGVPKLKQIARSLEAHLINNELDKIDALIHDINHEIEQVMIAYEHVYFRSK